MEVLSLCNWFKFKVGVTLEMHFLSTPIKLMFSFPCDSVRLLNEKLLRFFIVCECR
jgi:hypothetical protein